MVNEKWLIDGKALWTDIMMLPHNGDMISSDEVEQIIKEAPAVNAVEVSRIEKVKQEILQTLDTLIATHRDISNSRFANSAKYLEIPESSNDYYGIYAQAMEVSRRLVNAALTDLCDKNGWRE